MIYQEIVFITFKIVFDMIFLSQLSDQMMDPELQKHSVLLVDPAYHGNIGDNLIALGEIIFIEKMGFKNHTECGIFQSLGRSKSCGKFEHIQDGAGLVMWHGGGNWGDLWGGDFTRKRMNSFIDLLRKQKTIIGREEIFLRNVDLLIYV